MRIFDFLFWKPQTPEYYAKVAQKAIEKKEKKPNLKELGKIERLMRKKSKEGEFDFVLPRRNISIGTEEELKRRGFEVIEYSYGYLEISWEKK